jgi:hypothetical protein
MRVLGKITSGVLLTKEEMKKNYKFAKRIHTYLTLLLKVVITGI